VGVAARSDRGNRANPGRPAAGRPPPPSTDGPAGRYHRLIMTDDLDTTELTVTRVLPVVSELGADATADEHAEAAGLVYVDDTEPGIRRVRRGRGFSYQRPDGTTVPREGADRARINALAIPPAWTDVWICLDPRGHIQATGIDDAGRKQYRYHDRWRSVRDATKFHRMAAFAEALPTIRDTVDSHLRKRRFTQDKILALVVSLLDETLIRIGNDSYARSGGAYGLTTLRCEHVDVAGNTISFAFPGKSGQDRELELRHPRLARHLLRCEEIPGQRLFGYEHDDGSWRHVDSGAVNDYLREVTGAHFTAKDFRTWGGTVVAAETLAELGPAPSAREADANILASIDAAAERLGNTRAVARASYVDPRVPKGYRFGRFDEAWDDDPAPIERLSQAERAVQRILAMDLPSSADLEAQLAASLEQA
jgi:DNA topoisomerase I